MTRRAASPFSRGAGALLALVGIVGFFALLWSLGHTMDQPQSQPTQLQGSDRGFDGFAALGEYLSKRGYQVEPYQSGASNQAGLLIVTPSHQVNVARLGSMVQRHRQFGPTIVIMPKWQQSGATVIANDGPMKGKEVSPLYPALPRWPGWHDEITLDLYPMHDGPRPGGWSGFGVDGQLPFTDRAISATGNSLAPLVEDSFTQRILAGYVVDGGDYPRLREASPYDEPDSEVVEGESLYPLILVFEPDLLNNYGFSKAPSSRLAEKLILAALNGQPKRVMFDQSLGGFASLQQKHDRNLLKEAFRPPFLAATICLILAIAVAFWRALHRFGPPLLAMRSIAFGKRALVANAAGLIQRARRLHLLGAPYADAARERLVRALALPTRLDPAQAEAAIDRALAVRAPDVEPFSAAAARLRGARRPIDLVRAARTIHSLERTLMR